MTPKALPTSKLDPIPSPFTKSNMNAVAKMVGAFSYLEYTVELITRDEKRRTRSQGVPLIRPRAICSSTTSYRPRMGNFRTGRRSVKLSAPWQAEARRCMSSSSRCLSMVLSSPPRTFRSAVVAQKRGALQPFWQKFGKQWALQLQMQKSRRAAGGQRHRQILFDRILARRRATSREFRGIFFDFIPSKMMFLNDTCLIYICIIDNTLYV